MITSMAVAGYKCFAKGSGYIEMKNLNVFCGRNSSGKSSFIQPLLLLKQTLLMYPSSKSLRLNGYFLNLGNVKQIIPKETFEDIFSIGLTLANDTPNFKCNLIYHFSKPEKERDVIGDEGEVILKSIVLSGTDSKGNIFNTVEIKFNIETIDNKLVVNTTFPESVCLQKQEVKTVNALNNFLPSNHIFLTEEFTKFLIDVKDSFSIEDFFYISSSRQGPTSAQMESLRSISSFDPKGTNSLSLLSRYFGKHIDPKLACDHEEDKSLQYEKQVSNWMKYIFGSNVNHTELAEQINQSIYDNFSNSHNVGFGLSYTLHIILLCLAPARKAHIIIENPEAHLEPSALFKLLELLRKVSTAGTQLYIETHSDILVNAIRLFAHENKSEAENYSIFFVSKSSDQSNSIVEKINLDKAGVWPKGFFDQGQEILKKLYGI